MGKAFSRIGVSLSVFLLAGCVAAPPGGWFNTNTPADIGESPLGYNETVRNYLRTNLKDPYSLMDLSISEPAATSCRVGIYGPFNGWRVTVSYNAKNSFGAYVGLRTFYYWFHGERLKGIGEDASVCTEAPNWR